MHGEYIISILYLKLTLNQNQNLILMKLHLKRALYLERILIMKRTKNLYRNLNSMKLYLKRTPHLNLMMKMIQIHMTLHFQVLRFQRGLTTKVLEIPYHSGSVGNFHQLLCVLLSMWSGRIFRQIQMTCLLVLPIFHSMVLKNFLSLAIFLWIHHYLLCGFALSAQEN